MRYILTIIMGLMTLPAQAKDAHYCISEAIYFEARGESQVGMVAVGQVILNRVRSSSYPNHPCDVVYQKLQFSYYWDGKPEHINDRTAWRMSQYIARLVLNGGLADVTNNATHYHASYVKPHWLVWVKHLCSIGTHRFYRLKEEWRGNHDK